MAENLTLEQILEKLDSIDRRVAALAGSLSPVNRRKLFDNETEFLSLAAAATRLGVTVKTLRRWNARRKIEFFASPTGRKMINTSEIERVVRSLGR